MSSANQDALTKSQNDTEQLGTSHNSVQWCRKPSFFSEEAWAARPSHEGVLRRVEHYLNQSKDIKQTSCRSLLEEIHNEQVRMEAIFYKTGEDVREAFGAAELSPLSMCTPKQKASIDVYVQAWYNAVEKI